ncbi:MAG: ABC transporter ATP-binding protein [Methanofastidiosum sp.]
MLRVVNLGAEVEGNPILDHVNLYIKEGQTYVLFGPNGNGKTSLLMTLIGNPAFKVTYGRIMFKGQDINGLSTDQRVKMGMGISFQNPPKVSGLKLIDMLLNCAKQSGTDQNKIYEYAQMLNMEKFLNRSVNVGFSGGEVKRSEVLQLLILNPDLVLFDEPDSGVDLDNIAIIGSAMGDLLHRKKNKDERKKSGLIITHQGHILDYVDADYGLILYKGMIACMGNPYDMLDEISKKGYEGCVEKCLKGFQNSRRM